MPDTPDNTIVSVKEFPTCHYVFVVSTPFLCKHPAFRPPVSTREATGYAPPLTDPQVQQGLAS